MSKRVGTCGASRPDRTLQTTGLGHEAYLRLVDQRQANWQNRAQFFGVVAQMMWRVLGYHARSKHPVKRGGSGIHVTLEDTTATAEERGVDLIELDEALEPNRSRDRGNGAGARYLSREAGVDGGAGVAAP